MNVVDVKGWALTAAAKIDMDRPGFAGHFLRAGAERRQAIAAHLARRSTLWSADQKQSAPAEVAAAGTLLTSASAREIVEAAYGVCPQGFLGALGKSGHQPFAPGYYFLLHRILANPRPSRANARRCIQQLRTLSDKRLSIIAKLGESLRFPPVVDALAEPSDADDLMWVWRQLIRNREDKRELLHSVRQAARSGSLAEFALNWTSRINFPANPIPQSDDYWPLRNGRELRAVALQFQNCAADLLPACLEGTRHLAVYRCGDGSDVLVEIRPTPRGMCLEDVHAPRNVTVEPSRRREVVAFVKPHGVYPRFMADPGAWQVLRRLGACSRRWHLV